VLNELGAGETRRIEAVNKCDIADPWPTFPGAVMISAKTGMGLEELKKRIAEALQENFAPVTFQIPFDRYGLIAEIRPLGRVVKEQYTDTGTELEIMMAREDVNRLIRQYGSGILKKD